MISLTQRFISCKNYSLGTLVQWHRETSNACISPSHQPAAAFYWKYWLLVSVYVTLKSTYLCASLTLKRKVWVQRPHLAAAPTAESSGSTCTRFSATSHQCARALEGTSPPTEQPPSMLCSIGGGTCAQKLLYWAKAIFQSTEKHRPNSVKTSHNITTPSNQRPGRWDLLMPVLCAF